MVYPQIIIYKDHVSTLSAAVISDFCIFPRGIFTLVSQFSHPLFNIWVNASYFQNQAWSSRNSPLVKDSILARVDLTLYNWSLISLICS
uniref:Uncharacterized protein n=1 Tax=Physcomitrium patens TaxID=3218 RepID=A0A2K1K3S9_PHYPA|nr:hypothetical protein PHYPA_012900 [Physcomitrium patens]